MNILSVFKNKLKWAIYNLQAFSVSLLHQPKKKSRGLFIDGGSNLGQGYSFFMTYFSPTRFDAILIEPNPNCMIHLKEKFSHLDHIRFLEKAIWIKQEKLKFFGLTEQELDDTSQGGSVVESHNSSFYQSDKNKALEVEGVSFSDFLLEQSKFYSPIIVKMDIESAEYAVLDDLIQRNAVSLIDHLFVEFHSQYFEESEQVKYLEWEKKLIRQIQAKKVGITWWD